MSRKSSLRFVPSVESFEDRFNLSTVGTHVLYQDISVPTATSSRDYSAIAFVGGWGSSMYQYASLDPTASAGRPMESFSMNYAKMEFSRGTPAPSGSLGGEAPTVRRADPLPVLLVIADQRD